ncbi:MAG: BspA family leucine-rich repeat surface protein [Aeriscardovia sp.]|nr:BspA family leucine-rich repeat surface protein [Aeriscardovia sp.]
MRAYRSTLASGNAGSKYTVSIIRNNKIFPQSSSYKYAFQGNTTIVDNVIIGKKVGRCSGMFADCTNFNQNVQLSGAVIQCNDMFKNCTNLDQNIKIPDGVTSCDNLFYGCSKLNQNIKIPNSAVSCSNTFYNCTNLNKPIDIPSNVGWAYCMFTNCTKFNQPVNAPGVVTGIYMFSNCVSLNQNVQIASDSANSGSCSMMFDNCRNFNQNFQIPPNTYDCTGMFGNCINLNQNIKLPTYQNARVASMFYGCSSLNQNISIPATLNYDARNMFNGCSSLDQPIYISDNVNWCSDMFRNTNMTSIGHLPKYGKDFTNMFADSKFNSFIEFNTYRHNAYESLPYTYCSNMFANSKMNSDIVFSEVGNINGYAGDNMLRGCKEFGANVYFYRNNVAWSNIFYDCNRQKKKTIHCLSSDTYFFNQLTSNRQDSSLVGVNTEWTDIEGGRYNASYNIYVYNDLTL